MDGNKPSALKVRQGLQEFMTQSREMSFGTNTFWMRINCKPEITLFHLKSNEKQKIEII